MIISITTGIFTTWGMYRLITVADSLESLVVRRRKKLGFDTSADTQSVGNGKENNMSQKN